MISAKTFKNIFNADYPGAEKIYKKIIVPVFENSENLLESRPLELSDSDTKKISHAHVFAKLSGTFPILFADVELKKSVDLKRSRVNIKNCIVKIMDDLSCAIIFFHFADSKKEWRVSFVNRRETLKDSTNPKRYTYLCGEEHSCRTISERFALLAEKISTSGKATHDDLTKAFEVEALSDEFFAEYKIFYEDFVQYITGIRYIKQGTKKQDTLKKTFIHKPHKYFEKFLALAKSESENKNAEAIEELAQKYVRDFIKKLMGRLVFLQFLQKKAWLAVPSDKPYESVSGDKNYLQNLFARTDEKDDFLNKVLNVLFFDTLNKQRVNDEVDRVLGAQSKIPFLNGGLFEKDPKLDTIRIAFPQEMFSNPECIDIDRKFVETKTAYPYTESCGLLDFFTKYNFTIDETDSDENEIGVDPEMLGRIFENLLEDNKDKGAFYTPKEIVRYMCSSSLIEYLKTNTAFDMSKINELVLEQKNNFTKAEVNVLKKVLERVKICDPAVGSGAFPMGLMNELLKCYIALGEDEAKRAEVKKHIVKNNIYGVDIEKGAVDIARLRFWLAIIVDETKPLPLPNLDYKIMQGNSLLESYDGVPLDNLLRNDRNELFNTTAETVVALQNSINEYYETQTHKEKENIKKHISEIVVTLLDELGRSTKNNVHEKLKRIELDANPYFFLWHTWFSEVFKNGGFDIVIANPPYIQLQKNSGELSQLYKDENFESFNKMGDIYQLFYERGIDLLKQDGHLCYITSNKWMRAGYGETSRKFFAERTQPKILIDLAGEKVFKNATVDVNILLLQKGNYTNKTVAMKGNLSCLEKTSDKSQHVTIQFPAADSWVILNPIEQRIKEKIEKIGTPLKDWDIQINYGIKTGCNEAFIIDGKKREELIASSPNSVDIIRPILRGKDIKRYTYNFADKYLIATFPSRNYDIDDYPAIKEYLLNFGKTNERHLSIYGKDCWGKKRLEQSGNKGCRKKTNNKWFELQDTIAYWDV